jgi:uncharacterized BrkB/YihY/UPF0761 family membrane protein
MRLSDSRLGWRFYFFFALFPALLLLLIFLSMSAAAGSKGRAALLDSFAQVLPGGSSALIAPIRASGAED